MSVRPRQSALWPAVLDLGATGDTIASAPPDLLSRLCDLLSPAFAAELVSHMADDQGQSAVDPALAARSRLFNRFARVSGLRWARCAEDHGIEVVAIKGLANAHRLYADPDLRVMSDADLLVRKDDLPRLLAVYREAGLDFRPASAQSRWGFVSDASFQPLTSADEASNVDLHVFPDAWPLHRALTTSAVFAAADTIDTPAGKLRVPCPMHMLLLTVSHAARDRFEPATAKAMVDAALLLARFGSAIDWTAFESLCGKACLLGPARYFFTLLESLGGKLDSVPERLRDAAKTAEFRRALLAYINFDTRKPGNFARLRREALLSSEPRVFLVRMAIRLRGLILPNRGLPQH